MRQTIDQPLSFSGSGKPVDNRRCQNGDNGSRATEHCRVINPDRLTHRYVAAEWMSPASTGRLPDDLLFRATCKPFGP